MKMLLRCSSTPVLNSRCKEALSMEGEFAWSFLNQRPLVSLAMCASPSFDFGGLSTRKMSKASSETDLRDLASKRIAITSPWNSAAISEEASAAAAAEEAEEEKMLEYMSSSSFLRPVRWSLGLAPVATKGDAPLSCFSGDGSGSRGGSGIGGGGGGGGCNDHDDDESEGFSGKQSLDLYYRRMIKADPGNSLLLSNYAKYLKEVKGDLVKAEEYLARSVIVDPEDGEVWSLFGGVVWRAHKDAKRALAYFDQAVKLEPQNCFVMGSYAYFLWNSLDEEVEDEENQTSSFRDEQIPPLAAAS